MKEEKITISTFTDQLDYKLETAHERIELLNNILYTEDKHPVEFFESLFDQDERVEALKTKEKEEGGKKKYINLLPTTKQPLSEDIYECKGLERMADYILNAPDQPRMNKQQEYSFYDKEGFKKLIKKEKLYEEIVLLAEKGGDNYNLDPDEIIDTLGEVNAFPKKHHLSKPRIKRLKYINKEAKMAFLKRMGENYKHNSTPKIYKSDLKDIELKYLLECQKQIDKIKHKLKQGVPNEDVYIVSGMIKSLRDMQIVYKCYKKGTIFFKSPLKDDGRIDYEMFDFFNKSHVLALLNMPKRQICDEDLPLLIYDLGVLMKGTHVREDDIDIVQLYRNGLTQEEIAKQLNIAQQNVNQVLSKLADSIIQEYERIYEDWYYLNKVKGKYKKCSKCGEIKLHNKFGKDGRNSDALKSICKKCDNLSKKS